MAQADHEEVPRMGTGTVTTAGRVVWHELMTTDPGKAKTFFADLLGWQTEVFKPGEMDYEMISVDGATHGGFMEAQGGAPSHWLGHICVDDADAAADRATKLGATVLHGPMDIPEVGRFVLISDPQGAVCSLYTPAGDGPAPEGVFAWDELLTTDVEASKAFYAEVVGWTVAEMDMGPMGTYWLFRRAGDVDTAGCMQKPAEMPGPAAWVTYLTTPDVDASAAKTKELGGSVLGDPIDAPGIGRFVMIADPTGAVVGLFQPAG